LQGMMSEIEGHYLDVSPGE